VTSGRVRGKNRSRAVPRAGVSGGLTSTGRAWKTSKVSGGPVVVAGTFAGVLPSMVNVAPQVTVRLTV
jgi:hypothetical protein